MARWILVAVCVAGLSVSAAIAWRWRGLARRTDVEPLERGLPAALRALRSAAVTIDAGLLTGFFVAGLLARLFMRVIAATSPDAVQGALTEAEETVGEVSFGGTFALMVFGGAFAGLAVAVVHRALRRWLPAAGWQAGIVSAAIALGLLGAATDLINPDNRDFTLLEPLWLAVAMIFGAALCFGAIFGAVYERLDRAVPLLGKSRGALAYVPVALVCVAGTPAVVIAIVLALAFTVGPTLVTRVASPGLARGGRVLVGAATVACVGVTAANVAEILG